MTIGERIKEIRTQKSIKQYELAEKAEISVNALINYEKNKRTPSLEMIDRIAVALGVEPTDLIYGKEDNPFKGVIETKNILNNSVIKLQDKIQHEMQAVISNLEQNNIEYSVNSDTKEVLITLDNKSYTLNLDDIESLYNETKKYFKFALNELIAEKQGN